MPTGALTRNVTMANASPRTNTERVGCRADELEQEPGCFNHHAEIQCGLTHGLAFSGQHPIECARAGSRLPRFEHSILVVLKGLNRVDFDVIGAKSMHYVVVLAGLAYPSVSPLQFALLKLRQWAVKSNKEHIKGGKQPHEARPPRHGLNDVFD